MQLNKILEQHPNKPFRRSSWNISFYLRATQDGKILVRNTGDPATGNGYGLSVKDLLADDWEVLELSENKVENELYVNSHGSNFIFLNGTLYKLTVETNSGELYKVK